LPPTDWGYFCHLSIRRSDTACELLARWADSDLKIVIQRPSGPLPRSGRADVRSRRLTASEAPSILGSFGDRSVTGDPKAGPTYGLFLEARAGHGLSLYHSPAVPLIAVRRRDQSRRRLARHYMQIEVSAKTGRHRTSPRWPINSSVHVSDDRAICDCPRPTDVRPRYAPKAGCPTALTSLIETGQARYADPGTVDVPPCGEESIGRIGSPALSQ